PTCFIAYTIKGFGLPFAGHKDNHAGLMNPDQMAEFRRRNRIGDGEEWDRFAGLDLPAEELEAFLASVPFNAQGRRRYRAEVVPLPESFPTPAGEVMSTQEGLGRILAELAREETPLAQRI